jgi:thiamine-phosphate pyrophosphorylase
MAHPASTMPDYSLYLVTDRGLAAGRPLLDIVRAAVSGGVTCVQLREKACSTREFVIQASALREVLRPQGIPLIINDRVDVALAVGADGVHLGQDDLPLRAARGILGPTRVIGISVDSVAQALEAERDGADYLGVSPVFATPTKTDTAPPLGLAGLAAVRRAVGLPLVAIGGIGLGNAAQVIRGGADGIAVVSAIVAAADPRGAAADLRAEIRRARRTCA